MLPNYGPLRITAIGDIIVARHAGMNDAAHATAITIAVDRIAMRRPSRNSSAREFLLRVSVLTKVNDLRQRSLAQPAVG